MYIITRLLNPDEDGITHINCYSKGLTELGRLLSNFAYSPFTCTDGRFNSIEGYWYWLSSPVADREQLRKLYGWQAKDVGRKLLAQDYPKDPQFELKIKLAIDAKLAAHPSLSSLLANSNLPLVHYYNYGGKVICDGKSDWLWKYYEQKRIQLQENK